MAKDNKKYLGFHVKNQTDFKDKFHYKSSNKKSKENPDEQITGS
jgi:hypothetical protein